MHTSGKYSSKTTSPHKLLSFPKVNSKHLVLVTSSCLQLGKKYYYSSEMMINIKERTRDSDPEVVFKEYGVLKNHDSFYKFRCEDVDNHISIFFEPLTSDRSVVTYKSIELD